MSSSSTLFVKFVFPVIWIAGWSAATYQILGQGVPLQDPGVRMLPWGGILGAAFLFWYCSRLRKVILDGETLVISDYRREVRVPLARVARVKRTIWINPRTITVTFDSDTGLGEKAVFMPSRIFWNTQWWKGYEA